VSGKIIRRRGTGVDEGATSRSIDCCETPLLMRHYPQTSVGIRHTSRDSHVCCGILRGVYMRRPLAPGGSDPRQHGAGADDQGSFRTDEFVLRVPENPSAAFGECSVRETGRHRSSRGKDIRPHLRQACRGPCPIGDCRARREGGRPYGPECAWSSDRCPQPQDRRTPARWRSR
jgi:hypothetical protein